MIEESLIGEIVNSKDGLYGGKKGITFKENFQIGWNQTSLPVMTVDDIGLESRHLEQFQGGFAKEDEPLSIIPIITLLGSI